MPIHDWTRVNPGLFHDFHQAWIIGIRNALNRGLLPDGYFALAEQTTGGLIPDVLTLQRPGAGGYDPSEGGTAVDVAPPQTTFVCRAETEHYAAKANRIVIRHPLGDVVGVIEIVSPGNKDSVRSLRKFVEKSVQLLQQGVHLLVIDLFPPGKRDPGGIHQAIWEQIDDRPFSPPADRPLTLASYAAGDAVTAYVEPTAVGSELPAMPIFLTESRYVSTPLESTYLETWNDCPAPMREAVAGHV